MKKHRAVEAASQAFEQAKQAVACLEAAKAQFAGTERQEMVLLARLRKARAVRALAWAELIRLRGALALEPKNGVEL